MRSRGPEARATREARATVTFVPLVLAANVIEHGTNVSFHAITLHTGRKARTDGVR